MALCKRLWTCRKTDCGVMMGLAVMMMMTGIFYNSLDGKSTHRMAYTYTRQYARCATSSSQVEFRPTSQYASSTTVCILEPSIFFFFGNSLFILQSDEVPLAPITIQNNITPSVAYGNCWMAANWSQPADRPLFKMTTETCCIIICTFIQAAILLLHTVLVPYGRKIMNVGLASIRNQTVVAYFQ